MKMLGMRCVAVGFTLALALPLLAQQTRLDDFKARFEKETDPIRRAKLIEKLGDFQFDQIRQQLGAGNIEQGLSTLAGYRDECASLHKLLRGMGVDAERKPAGFKQLEFSVRESLGRLQEIMAGLTRDDQQRFGTVRNELETLDRELIQELFPRQSKVANNASNKPPEH